MIFLNLSVKNWQLTQAQSIPPRSAQTLIRFDTAACICETRRVASGADRQQYLPCRSGGIGRRAWFRSTYSQGCGGSSPFFGTKVFQPRIPGLFSFWAILIGMLFSRLSWLL